MKVDKLYEDFWIRECGLFSSYLAQGLQKCCQNRGFLLQSKAFTFLTDLQKGTCVPKGFKVLSRRVQLSRRLD